MFNCLADWLAFLEIRRFLGRPEEAFQNVLSVAKKLSLLSPSYTVITVGGTNGKGSCVALLDQIYREAGYRVGAFTSPHLLTFNERIQIRGVPVSDEEILAAFQTIEKYRGATPLTYFQFAFLTALLLFQAASLDIVILEVGIGGRYDAVNLIDADLSMITSIDLDHCHLLGQTREAIAQEKAGIFRAKKPVICGDVNPPKTLLQAAKDRQAPLFILNRDFFITNEAEDNWDFETEDFKIQNLPNPPLLLSNAASVLMAVVQLFPRYPVTFEQLQAAFIAAHLSGRQELRKYQGIPVLFDVAHNPAAMEKLAEKIKALNMPGKKIAICGMCFDKDIEHSLEKLVPIIDEWYLVILEGLRGASLEQLSQALRSAGGEESSVARSPADAFRYLIQDKSLTDNDLIVVFGSFLTVSGVMKAFRF